jgi:hypothetical protein
MKVNRGRVSGAAGGAEEEETEAAVEPDEAWGRFTLTPLEAGYGRAMLRIVRTGRTK